MKQCLFFFALLSGLAFAGPQKFNLDTEHTTLQFKINHLVVATVTGRFNKYEGSYKFDEATGKMSDLKVKIEAASVDTNEAARDKHLRSPDFFNVEKFPSIEFTAKEVVTKDKKPVKIKGELSMLGKKEPLELDVDYKGTVNDGYGNHKMVFEAAGKLKRSSFGMNWNKDLQAQGGVKGLAAEGANKTIGDEVRIIVEAQGMLVK